jgi:polysaccharide export outer membrane protein
MHIMRLLPIFVFLTLPSAARSQEVAALGDLVLLPGDVIHVSIWREGELSGDFRVHPEGYVILPLLGQKPVTDLPWQRVRDRLLEAYQEELRNPSIELTPLRRIYVLGEVARPGLYPVDPTVSLAGAVALAGGATLMGDLRKLRVVRAGVVVLDGIPSEAALSSLDVRSEDEIFVGRQGWFYRNSTFVISALLSVSTIVISLAR